jgi:DNA invertase Pin-like site-specific DNA recombinase
VSTGEQTVENQLRELRDAAERHGWIVTGEFVDHGISGTKGREKRPQFDALCKAVSRKEIDFVAAWSIDRLSRSMKDLLGFLAELQAKGVDLYLHQQALDTSTPAGRAMFQMCGVFAEFERAIIVERVKAGLARARATGKTLGRPMLHHAVEDRAILEDRIVELARGGTGKRKIAREVGCGVSVVQRVLAAARR